MKRRRILWRRHEELRSRHETGVCSWVWGSLPANAQRRDPDAEATPATPSWPWPSGIASTTCRCEAAVQWRGCSPTTTKAAVTSASSCAWSPVRRCSWRTTSTWRRASRDWRSGDEVAFSGVYEWSAEGGTIHWTHAGPGRESTPRMAAPRREDVPVGAPCGRRLTLPRPARRSRVHRSECTRPVGRTQEETPHVLRQGRRPFPDQGQDRGHHRLRQPGPRARPEPARQGRHRGRQRAQGHAPTATVPRRPASRCSAPPRPPSAPTSS